MRIAAFVLLTVGLGLVVGAQESRPAPRGPSFEDYRIITTRNIFNSNRRAPTAPSPARTPRPSVAPAIETIALTGVVVRDRDPVVLFASSVRDASGTRPLGGSIVGFSIERIERNHVVISRDGQEMTWPIGGVLRRIDGGDWYLPESAAAATDITADPAAEAAILNRMRARRAQEAQNE
jgi:type II secretory pathway component PulC